MPLAALPKVTLFAHGSCLQNPGAGGYSARLVWRGRIVEAAGGFACTTDNRMDVYSLLAGLERLSRPARVVAYCDSRTVVASGQQGLVGQWRDGGWRRGERTVPNADLWERLLFAAEPHRLTLRWLRQGSEHPLYTECVRSAREWASRADLPPDPGVGLGAVPGRLLPGM